MAAAVVAAPARRGAQWHAALAAFALGALACGGRVTDPGDAGGHDAPPAAVDGSGPADAPAADAATGDAGPSAADAATDAAGPASAQRGYWTSGAELEAIAARAAAGDQPYRSALDALVAFAGAPDAWSYGSLDGAVSCGGASGGDPGEPAYIANSGGGPLVLAKAYMFHLTGDAAWAADARARILDLVDTTGWGGDVYSGANQCILNLSWFVPRFIQAADLLADWPGWSAADRDAFAGWLATVVYRKTSWASENRVNNWGSAGSYTSAMIADYLVGTGVTTLVERDGTTRTPAEAWAVHVAWQYARMNGTDRMDSQCSIWGIQDHGGIPDELRRGSSGCGATYIVEQDASYTYQLAHVQSLVAHAELLLRRGDAAMFDNVTAGGMGSVRQSIRFVIVNPTRAWPWLHSHHSTLEIAYRHYRDADMCADMACDEPGNREIADGSNRVLSFATLTHGFAPGEDPGAPPAVPPPGP